MAVTTLSENWKKLQQRLPQKQASQVTKSALPPLRKKRKMISQEPSTDNANNKRPRLNFNTATKPTSDTNASSKAGKYIALDCEMVGTHDVTQLAVPSHNRIPGKPPEYSILARASLVDFTGATIYDAYVLPSPGVRISDYRTRWSGITEAHLTPRNTITNPKAFVEVQKDVHDMLKDRVVVGHALKNDLEVLGLSHPKRDIRDTSRLPKYRELAATMGKNGKLGKGRTPGLKRLAQEVLGLQIQDGQGHSSVEDARATMLLFKKEKAAFEEENVKSFGRRPKVELAQRTASSGKGTTATNGIQDPRSARGGRDRLKDDIQDDDDPDDDITVDDDDEDDVSAEDEVEAANIVQADETRPKKKKKKKNKKSRTKR